MDLVNSHSDAVAVFGETSPVVVKHLPTIKDELPKAMYLESQFHRWKRRANVRSTLPPRGQIDADVQLRAPRSGFSGPIARPAASVLLISVFMTRTKTVLEEQQGHVSVGLLRSSAEVSGKSSASLSL